MSTSQSQNLESFLPTYPFIPEEWEQARQFLTENLKMTANSVNVKEIGWYLEEEVITGKQFFPGANMTTLPGQYRTIFRIVVDFSPLAIGVNSQPHGITIDENFRLINLYGAATITPKIAPPTLASGTPINQPNIDYDATNINITSAAIYDYAQAVMEFIKEA